MSRSERAFYRALKAAREKALKALEACPDHYGIKADLHKAFAKLEESLAWFEQTHH